MSSPNDLTTIAAVQDWLSSGTNAPGNSDSVISRLITTCSASILSYLQRSSFLSQSWTDVFDGKGKFAFFLNEWPATSITSVTVDGIAVPASVNGAAGWVLSRWNGYPPGGVQTVEVIGGYCFTRGIQNVSVVYQAGYLVQNEAGVVPAGSTQTITALQPQGMWARDEGVTYADGTPLVQVPSNPTVGQYTVQTGGIYTFNAGDIGQAVLLSYSYVPWSVEDAAMNWVAERYRYRTRIGQRSQSIGGQTSISYDLSDIPAYIKKQLQQFRKVLPV